MYVSSDHRLWWVCSCRHQKHQVPPVYFTHSVREEQLHHEGEEKQTGKGFQKVEQEIMSEERTEKH